MRQRSSQSSGSDTTRRALALGMLIAASLSVAVAGSALAQTKPASSPFQGFSSDSGKPVDIKSESLEVHQNEQKAIFSGSVVATQGESVLHADELTVYYNGDAGSATPQAPSSGAGAQTSSIKRLEAAGNVVVTSQDQKATGTNGVFDMAANTATLTGGVILTQGQNVIRGKELVVNLKTGVARVVGGTSGLFVPSSQSKPQ